MASFKTEEQKNEAKKIIKNDISDLMIVEGSESELEVSLEMSSNAQKVAKSSALNQKLQHFVIVSMS